MVARIRRTPVARKAASGAGSARLLVAVALLAALVVTATEAYGFSFDDVTRRAEKLAAGAYQKPSSALPKSLKALNYDEYRDIRFRPDRALWRRLNLPF